MSRPQTLTSAVDTILDRGLVGYTSIGFNARRRLSWPADPAPAALVGKVAIVTGGGAGLGKATAAGLLGLGARVRIVVRDQGRGEAAAEDLRRTVPGCDVRVDLCDVSSLQSVADYASDLPTPVDVLVHNAGVMPKERTESADGHELCLATHVLGPHLMTRLLQPALQGAAAARVIWVSSGGMYAHRLDVGDLEYDARTYRPAVAYARTKRTQVVLADEWARRSGLIVHSMHPGWANTPGIAESLPTFRRLIGPALRTPDQGADTVTWLAAAAEPAQTSGELWHDRSIRTKHYVPWTKETADERSLLFDKCEELASHP